MQKVNIELLQLIQDLISIAEQIEAKISKWCSVENKDDEFFIYHFFHRSLGYAKSAET